MLITLARKPLMGSVVNNVLAHGCGTLNIDASRIGIDPSVDDPRLGGKGEWNVQRKKSEHTASLPASTMGSSPLGRWPANVLHDGSDAVLAGFPDTASVTRNTATCTPNGKGMFAGGSYEGNTYSDSGSAARYFKQIKGNDTP